MLYKFKFIQMDEETRSYPIRKYQFYYSEFYNMNWVIIRSISFVYNSNDINNGWEITNYLF